MARKNYSEEFRRQAVDLYKSTPGATVRGIAEDLGIVRGTLRHWLEAYGTGKKTAADGTLTSSPLQSKPPTTSLAGRDRGGSSSWSSVARGRWSDPPAARLLPGMLLGTRLRV
jgi:transposase